MGRRGSSTSGRQAAGTGAGSTVSLRGGSATNASGVGPTGSRPIAVSAIRARGTVTVLST